MVCDDIYSVIAGENPMSNDIAYANADFIPNADAFFEQWQERAAAFRETEAAIGRARLNVAYGPHDREKLDLFHPAGPAKGLLIFVHGGYWMRFDRSYWSHLSKGATAHGWAVAMPSYPLAPEFSIGEITRSITQAVEKASSFFQGSIVLAGHSAGGHLVARMGCRDLALSAEVRARLKHIVPISAVSDLAPLIDTALNDTLRLDDAQASSESPINHPSPEVRTTVWVGAEERPAFLDQSMWLAEAWGAKLKLAPGRHHFDVIDGLEDPDSPLIASILQI